MPDFAVDLDMPAGLLGEAVDHAEAEAGSLAVLLRRKERIEDAAEDLGRYPAAGIGNREHDVIARRHFGIFAGIEFVEILVRGLDRETPPVRHGVARDRKSTRLNSSH